MIFLRKNKFIKIEQLLDAETISHFNRGITAIVYRINTEIRPLEETLKKHNFRHVIEPFDAGEISFHSGWLFDRAGANNSGSLSSQSG